MSIKRAIDLSSGMNACTLMRAMRRNPATRSILVVRTFELRYQPSSDAVAYMEASPRCCSLALVLQCMHWGDAYPAQSLTSRPRCPAPFPAPILLSILAKLTYPRTCLTWRTTARHGAGKGSGWPHASHAASQDRHAVQAWHTRLSPFVLSIGRPRRLELTVPSHSAAFGDSGDARLTLEIT